MADDEQPVSKRERQKQRKQAKREAEQAAKRRARGRKLATTAVVVVVALAAIGGAGFLWQQSRAERGALLAAEAQPAQAAGCQGQEEPPDLGAGHFSGDPEELRAAPPSEIYDHRPTTSGPHLGATAVTGVYDEHVDERLVLHNMEHGYVVVWWDPELAEDQVAEIQEWAEGAMGDANDHLIAAPYSEALPDGGQVGLVAWGYRVLCDEFAPEVADAFVDAHADNLYSDHGPTGATEPGQGLQPGEDQVVFPPLADFEAPEEDGVEVDPDEDDDEIESDVFLDDDEDDEDDD